jgi:enediyne biosynthesis protein E4
MTKRRRVAWLPLALTFGLLGCRSGPTTGSVPEKPDGPAWFADVTDAVGLDFVHNPGPTDRYFMPASMGSGAAFIHEIDGTLYLYLLQNAGPDSKSVNRLYRWQDGRFHDVTVGSGLDVAGFNMGVAIADVNNDGLPDVLVTQYGGVKLFLNRGHGKFDDVTAESGLSNPVWGMSAAFFDYDRDGWLDLILVNYVDYNPKLECVSPWGVKDFCGPISLPGTCTRLFHNLGTGPGPDGKPARVRFEDVSFESGIGRLPGPGLGVVCADFDGDGWPDIFVANDGMANRLWINQHNGKFVDEALLRNVAYTGTGKAYAGMGVAIGDVENRGFLDLYVSHLGHETNTLWKQGPRGEFHDCTVEAGLTSSRWRGAGFGTLMADFDLDGFLDIAVVNGRVNRIGPAHGEELGFWSAYAERNQVFANDGKGHFRDISEANKALCGRWNVARGLARADYDDDGAPDLVVTTIGDRARLFHNVAVARGHWLKVRALQPTPDGKALRDAYGAEVRVRSGDGEFLRLVNPAESYLCSSSPLAHFGLGKATTYESIQVTWPDGDQRVEVFGGGPADRTVVLRRGEGRRP